MKEIKFYPSIIDVSAKVFEIKNTLEKLKKNPSEPLRTICNILEDYMEGFIQANDRLYSEMKRNEELENRLVILEDSMAQRIKKEKLKQARKERGRLMSIVQSNGLNASNKNA